MCGRYSLRRSELLPDVFRALKTPPFEEFSEHGKFPRFNIAPSLFCPIIRLDSAGKRVVTLARWGLVPSWTKDKPKLQPINAKGETVATSGMFRKAMERRRCLVPADGFYEWQGAKPPKQPYFVHMKDDSLFAFAGLWERWKPAEDAEPIDTFTIITTTPNALMAPIHNRMPVIVGREDYDRWLSQDLTPADVADVLKPFDAGLMDAYPVSTKVNKPGNDGPELLNSTE